MSLPLLTPDWPAPAGVYAAVTTRVGGSSVVPYDSLNMGGHVNDDPDAVRVNRQRLAEKAGLPGEAFGWIQQVHGARVVALPDGAGQEADAAYTTSRRQACAILTADCLPVLFCSTDELRVAAAHAGWRGLAAGVLENTVAQFSSPKAMLAWLGPAIGPRAFEVGPEVREAFMSVDTQAATAFMPVDQKGPIAQSDASIRNPSSTHDEPPAHNHNEFGAHKKAYYFADIYLLARQRLIAAGMKPDRIYGGGFCTLSDAARFYSYRRDGETGRMASLIWME
ncbi:peptidoglycan editing factor PgeF [Marinobacter fonticola]|uniref:peptidoglycan editing factor PgeF n=1 Tax=Marinobacter fonticola TaxID=2603215 RepID=UPI0011E7F43E|nr:peptidoglycan editing factor PgeF [Marinobacter fonticola]